jgi:hypothetical protein
MHGLLTIEDRKRQRRSACGTRDSLQYPAASACKVVPELTASTVIYKPVYLGPTNVFEQASFQLCILKVDSFSPRRLVELA